jgi:hypothetical protein
MALVVMCSAGAYILVVEEVCSTAAAFLVLDAFPVPCGDTVNIAGRSC